MKDSHSQQSLVIVSANDLSEPNGATTRIISLALALQKRGVEVSLIAPLHRHAKPIKEAESLEILPVRSYPLETMAGNLKMLVSLIREAKRVQKLKRARLQIEVSVWGGYFALAGFSNYILDVHTIAFDEARYSRLASNRILVGFYRRFAYFLEKLGTKRAGMVIAVSEPMKEFMVKEWKIPADKVAVIPNGYFGAKVAQFSNLSEVKGMVSFVGGLARWVKLDKIIHAAKALKDEGITFYIVGDGSYRSELETMAKKDNLSNVIFTGFIPVDEAYEIMAKSQVVLYPLDQSFSKETSCPVKLMDYMGLGKAMVIDRVSEVALMLEENEAALACDPHNENEFIHNIRLLCTDEALRKKIALNAKKLAGDFSWEKQGEKLAGVLEEMPVMPWSLEEARRRQQMKLNILMLLPLRYGPSMRVKPQIEIFSYLVKFGHQISWLVSLENSKTTQQFLLDDLHIYGVPFIPYLNDSSLFKKVFNRIPVNFRRMRLALKLFKDKNVKYDMIFVRDDTISGLIGAYIKRRRRIPFVYELTDPIEQEWEGYKIEAKRPLFLWYLITRLKALLKTYIMKKADLILVTTRWFEEALVRKGISKAKLMPFLNGVDIESFSNKDGKDIRDKYHLDKATVIIYAGTMGRARNLSVLLRAFSKVKDRRGNVKLLMVGEGTDESNLRELASDLGITDDVIFVGQAPHSEVPYFIAAADIGVSPVPPLSFYKVSSPIKALEYMAMGKPVVANEEILEHKEVVEESGGGVLVPFDDNAFADAIIKLMDDPETAREMGRRGSEWVVRNRNYEILAQRLETRLLELIRSQRL